MRRFRSSAFDIFRVSRRNRLQVETDANTLQGSVIEKRRWTEEEGLSYMVPNSNLLGFIVAALEEGEEPSHVEGCCSEAV